MTERENPINEFESAAEEEKREPLSLETISKLATHQLELQNELDKIAEKQREIKKNLQRISMVDLPEAMDSISLSEVALTNGFRVIVSDGVDANITKANAPKAPNWLADHGHGDLIKREIKASLPRGDDDILNRTIDFLEEAGISFDEKEAVHPATLKKFVREQLERGVDIPEDIFGIFNYRKTTIEPADK